MRKTPQSVYQKYLRWLTQQEARDKQIKGKTIFLGKKLLHKKENGFTMDTQKFHITWWIVLLSNRFVHVTKYFFHISKCLACNAKKSLQLKITKKNEWANFIYTITVSGTNFVCSVSFLRNWNTQSDPAVCFAIASLIS